MKQLLITIAAVVLVGCGESQQSAPAPEVKPAETVAETATPEPQTAKAPDISIHDAAYDGNIEAVKQHLAAGADVNAKDEYGGTPLDFAIAENKTETANLIRKHGGKYGSIQTAAGDGDTEAVKEFLATGVDVNAKDPGGFTPLHFAAMNGNKENAELLIAKGADVKAKNIAGSSPLHSSAYWGYKEIAELLIAEGADVNAKDYGGELLIAEGADVNAKDYDGDTALDLAIQRKHPKTADLLRKHGGKTRDELKVAGN